MNKRYKCLRHKSNEGYIDKNGKWHCWYCYSENLYLNPKGVVLKELEVKKYTLRIVDRTTPEEKSIWVEVFTRSKILDHNYNCRDLSVAIRHFESLVREILEGNYRRRRYEHEEPSYMPDIEYREPSVVDLPEEDSTWEEFVNNTSPTYSSSSTS